MIEISKFGDIAGYVLFNFKHPLRQIIGRYYTFRNDLESFQPSEHSYVPESWECVSFFDYKLMKKLMRGQTKEQDMATFGKDLISFRNVAEEIINASLGSEAEEKFKKDNCSPPNSAASESGYR